MFVPFSRKSWAALAALALGASLTVRGAVRPSVATAAPTAAPTQTAHDLRVCADPDNMPFSNRAGQGFENALAELLARSLHRRLSYVWWAERRGFLRNTLNAGRCDVVMGWPEGFEGVLTTAPVYRSSYVLVQREEAPKLSSLADPRLQQLRIGVPLVGDDGANPPPVRALVERGLVRNMRGFTVYGDGSTNPLSQLIRAVSQRDIDVAIAWGPTAGYYAKRATPALATTLLRDEEAPTGSRFSFAISLAVRRNDTELHSALNRVLHQRRSAIVALLRRFDFPTL